MLVRDLEAKLFEAFPCEDAEPWDHVGLSVGNPDDEVHGVACALDVTEYTLRQAESLGCNVLLTHHPLYIEAPDTFSPFSTDRPHASGSLFYAVQHGVSVISMHTNLDRSRDARELLPSLCGLKAISSLEHSGEPDVSGLGSLCAPVSTRLSDFALTVARAFGVVPRVWGEPERLVHRVAFLGGSFGHFTDCVIESGVDTLVTGEAGYHVAQDLNLRGCSVILLGHDISENPFVDILARNAVEAGVEPSLVSTIVPLKQWWTLSKGDML